MITLEDIKKLNIRDTIREVTEGSYNTLQMLETGEITDLEQLTNLLKDTKNVNVSLDQFLRYKTGDEYSCEI